MNRYQILETIHDMAHHQGHYNRLHNYLTDLEDNNEAKYNEIMKELERQNFKDVLDLIMYIEQ
jgi:hypothetical protein